MNLSDRVTNLKPSATLEITAKANKLKQDGYDVIGFGAGEPDFDTPENIKIAAIEAIKKGKTKYTPVAGIPELRESVANMFSRDYNVDFSSDEILVSCGGKHSLFNIFMTILNRNDEVILQSPYWVSYPSIIEICGGKPVIIDTIYENNFARNWFKVAPTSSAA
jgi:aspartate aminotransferase